MTRPWKDSCKTINVSRVLCKVAQSGWNYLTSKLTKPSRWEWAASIRIIMCTKSALMFCCSMIQLVNSPWSQYLVAKALEFAGFCKHRDVNFTVNPVKSGCWNYEFVCSRPTISRLEKSEKIKWRNVVHNHNSFLWKMGWYIIIIMALLAPWILLFDEKKPAL